MSLWCIGSAVCIAASGPGILSIMGSLCAVTGAIISVIGNLVNTGSIRGGDHPHLTAIRLWTASSFLMALWAAGHEIGTWDGGIGVLAVLGMNLVFLLSNLWGLQKRAQENAPVECTVVIERSRK